MKILRSTVQKTNLMTHIARVHLNISYQCDICDQYFASKYTVSHHKATVHKETEKDYIS